MTGRYETISVKEVMAGCKMQLRLKDSSHDDFLALYIHEGIRHLNCLSLFVKKQCTIEIVDLKSKLPDGFQQLLGLRYSKTTDGKIKHQNMLYIDKKYINSPSTTVSNYEDTFQINNGYIYYNNDVNATEATLSYLGLNIDEFGNMVVYSDYERALRAYGCYNFALSYSEDYKEATIQRYENTWRAQKAYIKSSDVQQDFKNRKYEMSKIMNAFLLSDFAVI